MVDEGNNEATLGKISRAMIRILQATRYGCPWAGVKIGWELGVSIVPRLVEFIENKLQSTPPRDDILEDAKHEREEQISPRVTRVNDSRELS